MRLSLTRSGHLPRPRYLSITLPCSIIAPGTFTREISDPRGRCEVDHRVLRELIRHLQEFEELFHSEGIDTLEGPDGSSYSIWDLRRLYDIRDKVLAPQRARAIELFLYRDMREQDAAALMGLAAGTPVAIYATQGLKQLSAAWSEGLLWKRGEDHDVPEDAIPKDADAPAARNLQGAGRTG